MALIRSFNPIGMSRNSVHDEIEATFTAFVEGGKKYVQMDTYGREQRDIPGKKSQTIQFDEDGARQLVDILRREFGI